MDGFAAVLRYFTDYACGAVYEVGGSAVDITAVVLITSFGPSGCFVRAEGKFTPKGLCGSPGTRTR